MEPLGIRNNNPGNIRAYPHAIPWKGQVGSNEGYCVFSASLYGLRAIAKTLRAYSSAHGLTTVREMINRWAPPTENETTAYVLDVSQRMGVDPDSPVDIGDSAVCGAMVCAVVQHENGAQPYPSGVVAAAVAAL